MEKQVKIKLVSRVYDLRESDCIEAYIYTHPQYSDDEISTKIEINCTGTLSERNGEMSVVYEEPQESGMGKTLTTLSFRRDAPQTVSLSREGEVHSFFVFDESVPRTNYYYETTPMPFQMAVQTKRLINRIGEAGGTLHLDYKIDIRGLNVERTVIDLMVRESGEGA